MALQQEVRLQARAQSLAMGAMPAAMNALLQDDLVDCCQPGGALRCTQSLHIRYGCDPLLAFRKL